MTLSLPLWMCTPSCSCIVCLSCEAGFSSNFQLFYGLQQCCLVIGLTWQVVAQMCPRTFWSMVECDTVVLQQTAWTGSLFEEGIVVKLWPAQSFQCWLSVERADLVCHSKACHNEDAQWKHRVDVGRHMMWKYCKTWCIIMVHMLLSMYYTESEPLNHAHVMLRLRDDPIVGYIIINGYDRCI